MIVCFVYFVFRFSILFRVFLVFSRWLIFGVDGFVDVFRVVMLLEVIFSFFVVIRVFRV